ncbi:hypothetical protein SAXI111661_21520 [Saccharomonospora xinjiangensis]|uniref:hypothetical protein n=1 Tax=Saccharomonospora xinjiangensis TaxID=75294 RepID=UPI0010C32C42|nr:hypothetical protein EYD13_04155 [Saccharomonospora xinjiangensis]
MTTTAAAAHAAITDPTPTMASVFSAASTPSRQADPGARVLSVAQLRSLGIHPSTVTKRCRPGGPWRRLATGVVLLGTGEPTRHQLLQAAVAYLGDSVITGVDALRAHGIGLPPPTAVRTLVSTHRRLTPPEFVAVERTSRLPAPIIIEGLPFAPPARATIDAARHETEPDRIRRVLALALRDGLCTLDELGEELGEGNQRGSAAVRVELRKLSHTDTCDLRSAARQLARRCPLPPPRWDTTVFTRDRRHLGQVDAWWDDVGLAWSVAPITSPHGRAQDESSHLALAAAGVVLVRTDPSVLRHHGDLVVAELVGAFRQAARRPRPHVLADARVVAA